MSDGLIVPVRVEALLIGARDYLATNFAPAYANFSRLPYKKSSTTIPYLSRYAVNQPFTGNGPLEQGIHLRWQLPRALLRARDDGFGKLRPPVAPDRWLVTRCFVDRATPGAPKVTLRSWVVESNYLSVDAEYSRTTIPYQSGGVPQLCRYIGRVYELDDWLDHGNQGTYFDGLTSMGYGIPDFAGFYPNSRNVFGMLDASLNDVSLDPKTTSLAYTVSGWYAVAAQDPLDHIAIGGRTNTFGWLFDGTATPSYTVAHGTVYALGWRPGIAYFPDWNVAVAPAVAIGNTPAEAFSALAARKLANEPFKNVERMLNALQLGVLQQLGNADGIAKLEEALHDAAFASDDGGTLWDVLPKKTPVSSAANRRFPLADAPDAVARRLGALNDLQQQRDAVVDVMVALQRRIFADWQKYMVLYHVQPPPAGPVPSDVLKYVTAEIAELRDLDTARGDFAARIARLREEIEALLPDGLELVSIAAPRYYAPNDPVVLLSGDAVPGTPPDARATIACVLASNVLSSASFPAGIVSGSAAATVDASLLPAPAGALPHAVLAQLVQAELLLDPASADVPVAALAAQGGSQNPAVLDFTAAVTALVAAQQALIGGTTAPNGIAFAGKTPEPAIAMRAWRTPWNPVALSWRADVYPVDLPNGTYPERFVLDNFALDAGTFELELTGAVSAQAQGYAGTILLSPDASISLQNQITTYLRFVDDPELHDILTGLGSYPLLAQGLNGFDASLAMLEQILQMPVADPNAGDPINSYFSNTTVPNAVGPENRRGPLTSNAYNPLRAGKIAIRELLLVDEFGRSKKVDLEHLIVAETIPVDDMQTPPALVPPLRLAQSAQLWFRWLSAADPAIDATSLPATSPICGWAVPNHLSASMMWYDASGAAIGALTATAGGFVWQTAPGAGPAGQSFDDAFANRNPVLAAFARSMLANGTDYFIALLRTIDRTRVFVAPSNAQQDRATAVLLGAPLALVQADLSLELQGLPLPEQSYAALAADMQRPDPLHRTVRGFPQVRFPVTLGSLEQVDDGLIGYFLAPDGTADYATFYAEAANGEDAHIVVPEPSTITVAPADAQPRRVTMLVDARCAVHAFNGISPTKILTIPAEQYAQALATMAFTFLTSPVLTAAVVVTEPVPVPLPVLPGRAESRQFALPIPQEGDGTWTFVTYGEGRWTEIGIGTVDLNATFPSPLQLTEGWLKLSRAPKKT